MENHWPTVVDNSAATEDDIEHSKWCSKVHKGVLSKSNERREFDQHKNY